MFLNTGSHMDLHCPLLVELSTHVPTCLHIVRQSRFTLKLNVIFRSYNCHRYCYKPMRSYNLSLFLFILNSTSHICASVTRWESQPDWHGMLFIAAALWCLRQWKWQELSLVSHICLKRDSRRRRWKGTMAHITTCYRAARSSPGLVCSLFSRVYWEWG